MKVLIRIIGSVILFVFIVILIFTIGEEVTLLDDIELQFYQVEDDDCSIVKPGSDYNAVFFQFKYEVKNTKWDLLNRFYIITPPTTIIGITRFDIYGYSNYGDSILLNDHFYNYLSLFYIKEYLNFKIEHCENEDTIFLAKELDYLLDHWISTSRKGEHLDFSFSDDVFNLAWIDRCGLIDQNVKSKNDGVYCGLKHYYHNYVGSFDFFTEAYNLGIIDNEVEPYNGFFMKFDFEQAAKFKIYKMRLVVDFENGEKINKCVELNPSLQDIQ